MVSICTNCKEEVDDFDADYNEVQYSTYLSLKQPKKLCYKCYKLHVPFGDAGKARHGKEIKIYTDGSCIGNPGPGGWGFIIVGKDEDIYVSNSEKNTTNNRMELLAVINAIEYSVEN